MLSGCSEFEAQKSTLSQFSKPKKTPCVKAGSSKRHPVQRHIPSTPKYGSALPHAPPPRGLLIKDSEITLPSRPTISLPSRPTNCNNYSNPDSLRGSSLLTVTETPHNTIFLFKVCGKKLLNIHTIAWGPIIFDV